MPSRKERGFTGILEEALREYLAARPEGTALPLAARLLAPHRARPSKLEAVTLAAREDRPRKRTGRPVTQLQSPVGARAEQRVDRLTLGGPLSEDQRARLAAAVLTLPERHEHRHPNWPCAAPTPPTSVVSNGRSRNPGVAFLRRYVFTYALLRSRDPAAPWRR